MKKCERQLRVERERECYWERYHNCSSIYADSYNNCPSSSASSCHICEKHALNFRKHKQFPLNISFSTNHLGTPKASVRGIFNLACSSSITFLFSQNIVQIKLIATTFPYITLRNCTSPEDI